MSSNLLHFCEGNGCHEKFVFPFSSTKADAAPLHVFLLSSLSLPSYSVVMYSDPLLFHLFFTRVMVITRSLYSHSLQLNKGGRSPSYSCFPFYSLSSPPAVLSCTFLPSLPRELHISFPLNSKNVEANLSLIFLLFYAFYFPLVLFYLPLMNCDASNMLLTPNKNIYNSHFSIPLVLSFFPSTFFPVLVLSRHLLVVFISS